ncbi:hypothetical protein F5Y16DRAFT_423286 [Xylariaceae sp. FL0255]|nr:hypothetical protein F5Y16DRAFT_423286 [Xylariaceae sp. FL0255]
MASAPLDIKIIGGGVAGLAAGLALSRLQQGHQITIYESQTGLSELGAGIQLYANAVRILCSWGLETEFAQVCNQPEVMSIHRYADDSVIGQIAHNPQSSWEYGFPHWQCFRPDLQRLLAEACEREGREKIRVLCGQAIKSADTATGTLVFQDGSTTTADFVIAADGVGSRTRASIPDNLDVKPRPYKEDCFRAVVRREKMMTEPDTAELMGGKVSMVWCGPAICVLGYPVAGGAKYNIVVSVARRSDEHAIGKWSKPGDIHEVAKLLSPFCSRVQKLWSKVDECNQWTLGDLPEIPTFVSESGKFALVGDSAHAILPHAGQGGAMALEDAASIAEFVRVLKGPQDLPRAMRAWNDLRQRRLVNIRRMAQGNADFLTLPDGPGQEKRDQLWGAMTAGWKKELADMGEEGYRQRKVTPDPDAQDVRTPAARMYLYGYDATGEAKAMAKML